MPFGSTPDRARAIALHAEWAQWHLEPVHADLVARRRTDIEWVDGTAASMAWEGEFGLAIMTGHAFQALVGDDELRASLTAIRRALVDGGRFAFETRNSLARAWERWIPANAMEVVDPAGRRVRVSHEVESVVGDVVTFTETTSDADGAPLRVDRASLRFLDVATLAGFLDAAGLEIEAQYGDWLRRPLDPASPEIITVARCPRGGTRSAGRRGPTGTRGRVAGAGDATGWFEELYAEAAGGRAMVPWDLGNPHRLLVGWVQARAGGRRALVVGCSPWSRRAGRANASTSARVSGHGGPPAAGAG